MTNDYDPTPALIVWTVGLIFLIYIIAQVWDRIKAIGLGV